MATFTEHASDRRFGRRRGSRAAVAWLLMALLICLPGCRGCRKTPEQLEKERQEAEEKEKELEKKKKEKEKPPFEAGQPYVQPTNIVLSPGMYKPGHWVNYAWPNLKSNLVDFQGQVQTQVTEFAGGANSRVPLVAVPYRITEQRPAALAKEQSKSLESFTWIPPPAQPDPNRDDTFASRSVEFKLATAGGGATAIEIPMMLKALPSYQYLFVVLSRGSRFDYLNKRLDSIRSHRVNTESGRPATYYQVVTLPPNKRPNLPTSALCWTSIAYLLWDESDPTLWDLDQQQALVDWLHWGGQLIISGPDALEQLQNSFLRPYLPATVGKARTFSANDLMCLQHWAGESGVGPRIVRPWPGALLTYDPKQSKEVPYTGDTNVKTVIERPVGRGRIVVTAFRITGPEFSGWEGCDCFFNACLMRRGARVFTTNPTTGAISIKWADTSNGKAARVRNPLTPVDRQAAGTQKASDNDSTPYGNYVSDGAAQTDPSAPANGPLPMPAQQPLQPPEPANRTLADAATNTALRYFSRDAGAQFGDYATDVVRARRSQSESWRAQLPQWSAPPQDADVEEPAEGDDGSTIAVAAPGLCAWNDFGPVAQTARNALENATGIAVPPRSFIVWVVAGYLCVLVPANWLFFRLIRRVEWAWIAAPLIAIGCTVVVVHQAQLNLGFAQSRNEIAIIEMQPGYSRAHMTRYTALYTSLATSYELQLDDPGGQILPFSSELSLSDFRLKFGDPHSPRFGLSYRDAVCHRGDDTRLSGIRVNSNDKEYLHSEEMTDFGGMVSLHEDSDHSFRVTNGTKHPLENCQIIMRGESDKARMAAIDRLEPGATAKLKSSSFQRQSSLVARYFGKPELPTGELSDEGVRLVALHVQEMRQGEICFVARVADEVQGLTVVPEVPKKQFRQAALLVAHLNAGTLDDPLPDTRIASVAPVRPKPPQPMWPNYNGNPMPPNPNANPVPPDSSNDPGSGDSDDATK